MSKSQLNAVAITVMANGYMVSTGYITEEAEILRVDEAYVFESFDALSQHLEQSLKIPGTDA